MNENKMMMAAFILGQVVEACSMLGLDTNNMVLINAKERVTASCGRGQMSATIEVDYKHKVHVKYQDGRMSYEFSADPAEVTRNEEFQEFLLAMGTTE